MSAQFDYLDGQLRPTHPALLAHFAAASAQAVADCRPELDIRYSEHARQTLDLFRAEGQARGAVAYYHGGYWQSRDKADFRFLAPPLARAGFDVALVNYPFSPETRVAGIVEAARASLPCIAERTVGRPLILVGHSAGGQIVVELALEARVAGVLAISGVFDLAPLIGTTLNAKLELDVEAARAASPIHRLRSGLPPAVFAVGGDETEAFQQQTQAMCAAWSATGNHADGITVPGADHFSILPSLCDGLLRDSLDRLC